MFQLQLSKLGYRRIQTVFDSDSPELYVKSHIGDRGNVALKGTPLELPFGVS